MGELPGRIDAVRLTWRYARRAGAVGVGAALVLSIAAAAASAASFKPGTYSGKTSQGYAFAFVVKDVTCGHTKELCLKTTEHFEVSLYCNGGVHKDEYADPGPIRVPSSGVVHYTVKVNKNLQTIVMTIKLTTTGTANGSITASGHYCTSNGATGQPVTFAAKL